MSNDYTVVLKAMINEASLRAQIKELEKSLSLTLKTGLGGTSGGGSGTGGSGRKPAIDPAVLAANIQKTSAEIGVLVTGWKEAGYAVNEYSTVGANGMETLYKATTKIPIALGKTQKIVAQTDESTGELVKTQEMMNKGLDAGAKSATNFGTQMLQNIGKFVQWTLAAAVVAGSMRAIGEAVQYIEDLNKSMVETQVVTGETDSQIASLAQRYNSLAGTLGATTQQVAQGALEWRRQGKDVEESLQMTTASIMMSKLANMDAAQSTEQLTATLNGFKMQASDVTSVIDRLVKYCQNA